MPKTQNYEVVPEKLQLLTPYKTNSLKFFCVISQFFCLFLHQKSLIAIVLSCTYLCACWRPNEFTLYALSAQCTFIRSAVGPRLLFAHSTIKCRYRTARKWRSPPSAGSCNNEREWNQDLCPGTRIKQIAAPFVQTIYDGRPWEITFNDGKLKTLCWMEKMWVLGDTISRSCRVCSGTRTDLLLFAFSLQNLAKQLLSENN